MSQRASTNRPPWQLQHTVALGVVIGTTLLTFWLTYETLQQIPRGDHIARERLAALETERARQEAALKAAYLDDIQRLTGKTDAAKEAYERLQQAIIDDERRLRVQERQVLQERARLEALRKEARERGLQINAQGEVVTPEKPTSWVDQTVEWIWGSWEDAQTLAAEVKTLQKTLGASQRALDEAAATLARGRSRVYNAGRDAHALTQDMARREKLYEEALDELHQRTRPGLASARALTERWGGVLLHDTSALIAFMLHITTALSSLLMAARSAARFVQLRGLIGPVRIR